MGNQENIVLIGFMGSGKTTVGRILAVRLGRELIDMDELIEQRAGKKISTIFAEDGEEHFRKLERALVAELAGRSGLVITPGGGIVLNRDNIDDFERTGFVICLEASPEETLKRVEKETHRPLLEEGDKEEKIRTILTARKPLYDAIRLRVRTDGLTPEQVADAILRLIDDERARTG